MLTTLHLFAGAGGGLLADLILGHEPVCAVEWDPYCCQVLRERAAEGWFPGLHVFEGDVRVFPASDWKGKVDCIHAGFPCQPHSVAGKRKGHDDDRNLWPEVVRVVGEIRPPLVFLENVPGIISNGFIGFVLNDLADLGYDARWTCLGADQVGAPHRRERWWLLAYSDSTRGRSSGRNLGNEEWGTSKTWREGLQIEKGRKQETTIGYVGPTSEDVANASGFGLQGSKFERRDININPLSGHDGSEDVANATGKQTFREGQGRFQPKPSQCGWWKTEPDLGRVANGVASRVDRLKALGNGQVSLQAALAFKILMGDR